MELSRTGTEHGWAVAKAASIRHGIHCQWISSFDQNSLSSPLAGIRPSTCRYARLAASPHQPAYWRGAESLALLLDASVRWPRHRSLGCLREPVASEQCNLGGWLYCPQTLSTPGWDDLDVKEEGLRVRCGLGHLH